MVTGTHPEEIELFDYVEGELSADRRAEIDTHLTACSHCAEQIARVHVAKEALHASQILELPSDRRDAILASLPEQPRPSSRSRVFAPRRALAVLAPVAAVAAAIVVLVSSGVFDSNNEEGAGASAAGGGAATVERQTEDSAAAPEAAHMLYGRVTGPAEQVAAELRSKGIDAQVVSDRVEVRGATREEIDRALGRRALKDAGKDNGVEIVIVS